MLETIDIVIRNKKTILGSALIVALITGIIVFIVPKTYTATAKILPPQQDQGLMGLMLAQVGGLASSIANDVLGGATAGDTCVGFLQSDTISDRIIDKFNLTEVYEKKTRMMTRKALADNVSIQVGKKDGLVTIDVEDHSAERAANIANAYIKELENLTAEIGQNSSASDRSFMGRRINDTKIKLTAAENRLKEFQQKYGVIKPDDQMTASIQGLAILKAQLADAQVKLAVAQRSFREGEPEVKDAKTVIARLQRQIATSERGKTAGPIPNFGSAPEIAQEYLRLMRDFKSQEAVLEALTKQYEISRVSEAKDYASIQVVQKATVPDMKSKPKRGAIIVAAFFSALFLGSFYHVQKWRFCQLPDATQKRIVSIYRSLITW